MCRAGRATAGTPAWKAPTSRIIGGRSRQAARNRPPRPALAYLQSETAPYGTGPLARPATPPRLALLAVYGESAANSHAIPVGITLKRPAGT